MKMGRPPKYGDVAMTQISIRIPQEMLTEIDKVAAAFEMSRIEVVRTVISAGLLGWKPPRKESAQD